MKDIIDIIKHNIHLNEWHKLPIIRKILCNIGRHDFHFSEFAMDDIILKCSFCGVLKTNLEAERKCCGGGTCKSREDKRSGEEERS